MSARIRNLSMHLVAYCQSDYLDYYKGVSGGMCYGICITLLQIIAGQPALRTARAISPQLIKDVLISSARQLLVTGSGASAAMQGEAEWDADLTTVLMEGKGRLTHRWLRINFGHGGISGICQQLETLSRQTRLSLNRNAPRLNAAMLRLLSPKKDKGHAVLVFSVIGNSSTWIFDPNFGLYECDSATPGDLDGWWYRFLAAHYPGWTINGASFASER